MKENKESNFEHLHQKTLPEQAGNFSEPILIHGIGIADYL
jgi:hypothetical protein